MEITEQELSRLISLPSNVLSELTKQLNALIQEKLRRYIVKGFEPK